LFLFLSYLRCLFDQHRDIRLTPLSLCTTFDRFLMLIHKCLPGRLTAEEQTVKCRILIRCLLLIRNRLHLHSTWKRSRKRALRTPPISVTVRCHNFREENIVTFKRHLELNASMNNKTFSDGNNN